MYTYVCVYLLVYFKVTKRVYEIVQDVIYNSVVYVYAHYCIPYAEYITIIIKTKQNFNTGILF